MQDPTPYYQQLARVVTSVCGSDFVTGQIVAQVDAGYAELVYNCEGPAGRKQGLDSSFDDDRSAGKALHALRDGMPGDNKWSRATFTLSRDGTFKFDVGYAD